MATKIALCKLHNCFDVRMHESPDAKSRYEERVLNFADLIAANTKLPPITVTPALPLQNEFPKVPSEDFIVIDGRTRLAAYDLVGVVDVVCVVQPFKNYAEARAVAFGANNAGSEQPTIEERNKIVTDLIAMRLSPTKIAKLTKIPVGVIQAIVSKARLERLQGGGRKEYRDAIQAYKRGVGNAETIAARYGLDVADLKKRIQISERADNPIVSSAGLKSGITRASRKFIQSFQQTCKTAFEAYQDRRNFTHQHVQDVVHHVEKVLGDIQKAVSVNNQTAKRILDTDPDRAA